MGGRGSSSMKGGSTGNSAYFKNEKYYNVKYEPKYRGQVTSVEAGQLYKAQKKRGYKSITGNSKHDVRPKGLGFQNT